MGYFYFTERENLMAKLVEKTLEKGHRITFDEANRWYHEGTFPNPNEYAFYWTEFKEAAKIASWQLSNREDENPSQPKKEVVDVSRKIKPLDKARKEFVLNELTEMYIKNGCVMPSARDIKKNAYIQEDEVDILRRTNEYTEHIIRKRAEQKRIELAEIKASKEKHEGQTDSDVAKQAGEVRTADEKVTTKKYSHMTPEEYTMLIRNACEAAGYILTQTEVNAAAAVGELPCWNTLQKKVGPWYFWADRFHLKFKNEKIARIARKMATEAIENDKYVNFVEEPEVVKPESTEPEVKEPKKEPNIELDTEPKTEPKEEPKLADIPDIKIEAAEENDLAKLLTMIIGMKPESSLRIQGNITITFEV